MSSDILEEIDGAIADYRTSGDAMRWIPETERTEARRPADTFAAGGVVLVLGIDASSFVAAMENLRAAMAHLGVTAEQEGRRLVAASAALVAASTQGARRHGAVKHARDLRRAYRKRMARPR